MVGSTWCVLVNVSIGWCYMYRTAPEFCEQTCDGDLM
jgi:hypothetical protein